MINLNKVIFFITSSFPIALVFGRFATDLFVSISAIFIFIIFIKNKNYKNFFDLFIIIFFILCAYMVIRSLFSIDPLLSLETSLFYFRFGLFFLAILYSLKFYKKWMEMFFYSFLIAYSIIIIFCFIELITGFNITIFIFTGRNYEIQNLIYTNPRITGTFGEDVMLGSFISRTFPIFIASFIMTFKKNKYQKLNYIALFYIPILFYLNLLSFERSAIIYFLLFIFLFSIFNQKFKKISIYMLSILFIIFISSLYFIKSFFYRFITTTLIQSNYLDNTIFSIPKEYKSYFETALNIFYENFLFGVGTKIYRLECKNYITSIDPCNTHPHNYYLQLLSELGIFGFLIIAILFLFILYNIIKHIFLIILRRTYFLTDNVYCLYISSIICLFPLLPTGSFFNNYTSAILYLTLALLVHSLKNNYKN